MSAVLWARRQEYFGQGSPGVAETPREGRELPAHHPAAAALGESSRAAGFEEPKAALFESVDPAGCRLDGAGESGGGSSWR